MDTLRQYFLRLVNKLRARSSAFRPTSPPLICPETGNDLLSNGSVLVDRRHGRKYDIMHGIPLLVPGTKAASSGQAPGSELAEMIAREYNNVIDIEAIRSVLSTRFVFRERWIQIESDQFIDRVFNSSQVVLSGTPADTIDIDMFDVVRGDHSLSCIFDLERVPTSAEFSMNVTLRNGGDMVIDSSGAYPFLIGYRWSRDIGGSQDPETLEGHRTPLLCSIKPGHSMTIPVAIATPGVEGSYRLDIMPLQENALWFTDACISFNVQVSDNAVFPPPSSWRQTNVHRSYNEDHVEALRLAELWISNRFTGRELNIVEVGGNASPMIAGLDYINRINFDVDPYGLMIGKYANANHVTVGGSYPVDFVLADGLNLPIKDGWADVICVFSAFHHFPDPVELLRHFETKLSENGLILLMCEPVGHVHRNGIDDGYLAELCKGVNEQSFALWEYDQIFEKSHLKVYRSQQDAGSLKVALSRRGP
ncbi:class I SAM-dependent methyltransferase [Brevundimonas sanguinis]|uniref:class I SAM-dependent methyltransferase n=1 Tax=Brevundimonas sanguinis TaxID=3021811 RepID=UPI0024158556|nr:MULTISPECIES: methyltransferase domain-containing protein [Brevundimonas]